MLPRPGLLFFVAVVESGSGVAPDPELRIALEAALSPGPPTRSSASNCSKSVAVG